MNVLLLSPYPEKIQDIIEDAGDRVIVSSDKTSLEEIVAQEVDFIVSYGYRYIIQAPIIQAYKGRIVNLHISYLPYNRGSDPFIWACLDETPVGVSIHEMDEGLDTGKILAQRPVGIDRYKDTLATGYARLRENVEDLFIQEWMQIRSGVIKAQAQDHAKATLHRSRDKDTFFHLLPKGYDTRIEDVISIYRKSIQAD
ncbi:MAG: formyltransferase family protein [Terasakiella sp.]|uniref:formyltransferase family protein n=1 Tax=unclassified Terasakiella TaxID=2614952 RepID=UPI003AFFC4EF